VKSKIIKSIMFSTIGVLSASAISPIALTSCGKKNQQVVHVTGVTLNETKLELVEGGIAQLTATVLPENATDKNVIWKSNDKSIVNVDLYGKVKVFNEGTATVTVTTQDGNKSSTCLVKVSTNPAPIKVGESYGTWGNITVKYKLLSNYECRLLTKFMDADSENGYVAGAGVLRIPDHVVYNGENYYVKRIPSDWSDGENDVNGIEFESNVSHLKEICDYAFKYTKALNNYDKKICEFPEGLQYIGTEAFFDSCSVNLLGYAFPSTLNAINVRAFKYTGKIDFTDATPSSLTFRGNFNPENIKEEAFSPSSKKHLVNYVYAPTIEIATNISDYIKAYFSGDFYIVSESGLNCLIPRVIGS